jgi:hypothetical protein
VDFPKSADQTVLDEIICSNRIVHHGAGVAPQTRYQSFDL